MKCRYRSFSFLVLVCLTLSARSQESCYGAGQSTIHAGAYTGNGRWIGGMFTYEYGIHDLVSVGGSVGVSWWTHYLSYGNDYYYTYVEFPFGVRAMFHPFNLPVLAEKIPVIDKIDVYGGMISGWAPYISQWHDPGTGLYEDPDDARVGGFIISGVVGGRFYLTPSFGFYAEETAGSFGWINGGVVFKF